jgi:hypothetical protein
MFQKKRLAGIEHVLQFTAVENKVLLRSYRIILKKSGTRIPRVELEEIGPSVDWVLRRSQLASDDLFKTACKQVWQRYLVGSGELIGFLLGKKCARSQKGEEHFRRWSWK